MAQFFRLVQRETLGSNQFIVFIYFIAFKQSIAEGLRQFHLIRVLGMSDLFGNRYGDPRVLNAMSSTDDVLDDVVENFQWFLYLGD